MSADRMGGVIVAGGIGIIVATCNDRSVAMVFVTIELAEQVNCQVVRRLE